MCAEKTRVLLVDSDADARGALADLIQVMCDVHITFASDGEECLALPGEHLYDLMLLDLLVPKIDGFGLLLAMRSDPCIRPRYVAVFTGVPNDEGYRAAALDGGADAMFRKPFDRDEIQGILRRATGQMGDRMPEVE